MRWRLKNKLEKEELTKAERTELHNRIVQTTRFLDRCKVILGTAKEKPKETGFLKEAEIVEVDGRGVLRESVYVWDAVGTISDLLDTAPEVKTYFIDYQEFKRKESVAILGAVEDMVTEG
jgi:hypothetical protein